jgi:hypothetical protein
LQKPLLRLQKQPRPSSKRQPPKRQQRKRQPPKRRQRKLRHLLQKLPPNRRRAHNKFRFILSGALSGLLVWASAPRNGNPAGSKQPKPGIRGSASETQIGTTHHKF